MLSEEDIKNAQPKDKPYKLYDAKGLYLRITPVGGKFWRLKYKFEKKEKNLSFGSLKSITLNEARELANKARALKAKGIDPSIVKKVSKAMNVFSPIKLLRNQIKHLEEMAYRLESQQRELQDRLDTVNWDFNEITGFLEDTRMALKQLENDK